MKKVSFVLVLAAATAGCAGTGEPVDAAASMKLANTDLEANTGTMIRHRKPAHATQVMGKEDAEALERNTLPVRQP